jgi:hypothetical protein
MTAIKAFMSMPEEDRDDFYDRFLPELDPASTN